MKEINAWETSDGQLFDDEKNAEKHQKDIIGELLDALIPYDARGNISRVDKHSQIMRIIEDPALKRKILNLYRALHHE